MCVPAVEDELIRQASDAARQAVEDLRAHGLIATARTYQGNPAEVIINEAEEWDADCIFVGARGLGGIGRTILGSVSTMVALNASCSVEIVRHPAQTGA
jgi:nucleotide-binding universal stress UspA family protein